MDERSKIGWLHRRFGFGVGPGELDAGAGRGVDAEIARLVDPDAHDVAMTVDPWDDALFAGDPTDRRREMNVAAIDGWLERMRTTARPLEERMVWMWHDHFATSLAGVPHPWLMVNQVRTIARHALGSFPDLVRAMTVDPAMLFWLNGATSTGSAPNENYGRELLELFTVGIGNHTEDDVQAAARALTGYRVQRGTWSVRFVGRRHDDTRQTLLGTTGVHDADSVVDAVCSAPACATFVTTRVVDRLLGPVAAGDGDLVGDVASVFRGAGLEIRPMVEAIVEAGLDRAGRDPTRDAVEEAPVPWLVRAERATGARVRPMLRLGGLRAAGQVPMAPPDVGGWPSGEVWLAAAPVVSRTGLAVAIATAAPASGAARRAAASRDLGSLATALGRPEGFSDATEAALRTLGRDTQVLALALCAPDQVVV